MPSIDIDLVSKEEWARWKQDRVTKQAVAGLMNQRSIILEALADRLFSSNDERLMAIGEAGALKDAVMYMIENFDFAQRKDIEDVESDSVSDNS